MIETGRLRLRPWSDADRTAFAALVNTPAMTARLGGLRTQAQIDAMIDRRLNDQARHGCCYWAMELRDTGELVGSCGIRVADDYPGTPVLGLPEIGWRVDRAVLGQGPRP